MNAQKVGGIWFVKVWRLRFSFCIAKAGKKNNPKQLTFAANL